MKRNLLLISNSTLYGSGYLDHCVNEIKIIQGNHDGNLDPLIPSNIEILPSAGIDLGDIGLIHGHAWPSPRTLHCKKLIIGHVHPVIYLAQNIFSSIKQVWVKIDCNPLKLAKAFLKNVNINVDIDDIKEKVLMKYGFSPRVSSALIMPSFNDLLGGLTINRLDRHGKSEFIGPILRSGALNLMAAEVFLLDGTFIGNLKNL